MVESVVLDHAASDVVLLAGGPGDRRGFGVCLQAAGVGERLRSSPVSARACRGLDTEAREAQEYLGIGMLAKADIDSCAEIFTGLTGRFELLQ